VFFGAPAAIFDLASFNFQVPICVSLAKHTAAATKHIAIDNRIVFVFMFPPSKTNCRADLPRDILVLRGAFCNSQFHLNPHLSSWGQQLVIVV
jgi:hypothetical protein